MHTVTIRDISDPMSILKNQSCTKCGEIYPLTRDNFGQTKQKSGNVTWRKVCRACMRKNTAKHYAKNPEKVIQRVAKRKQQDIKADGYFTENDISKIRKELVDKCRYCRKNLNGGGEVEHMTPISQGGSNRPSNITLACFQCNKEKHGKTLSQYIQWRKDRGLETYERIIK